MDSILQLVAEKRVFLGRTREKVLSKARTHFKIFRKEVKKKARQATPQLICPNII